MISKKKRQIALDLIASLHSSQNLVISTQVLQEFFNVTAYKLKLDPVKIQQMVSNLSKLPVVLTDILLIE